MNYEDHAFAVLSALLLCAVLVVVGLAAIALIPK
ncbi:hypothetical protein SAMN04488144_14620 [Methylobacterium sp. 190mf]|nr:hypothetical protein SAMN04488144_14620 [Methylobacterium sp. 190mf]